jgi:hypothetical protein
MSSHYNSILENSLQQNEKESINIVVKKSKPYFPAHPSTSKQLGKREKDTVSALW